MNEDKKKLRGWEMWVADRAGPIFAAVALAIIVGAVAIFVVFLRAGSAEDQVNVLKPQVMRVNKAICDRQSLGHAQRAERCAERIRVGLVNCRHSSPCRAAFLALATYPPPAQSTSPPSTTATTAAPTSKGVMPQQPSNHGHQQPGPGSPGYHGGDQGEEREPSPSPPPAPSPSPAPEPGPPAESPGNGAQGTPGDSSPSGAGVELCVLERTCVGLEVGASPKGILP